MANTRDSIRVLALRASVEDVTNSKKKSEARTLKAKSIRKSCKLQRKLSKILFLWLYLKEYVALQSLKRLFRIHLKQ